MPAGVKKVREKILLNGRYITVYKETSADLVKTSDGSDVQKKLDIIQDWIDNSQGGSDFKFVRKTDKAEFPAAGNSQTLYVATGAENEEIYVWDNDTAGYQLISSNPFNITAIKGGKAAKN